MNSEAIPSGLPTPTGGMLVAQSNVDAVLDQVEALEDAIAVELMLGDEDDLAELNELIEELADLPTIEELHDMDDEAVAAVAEEFLEIIEGHEDGGAAELIEVLEDVVEDALADLGPADDPIPEPEPAEEEEPRVRQRAALDPVAAPRDGPGEPAPRLAAIPAPEVDDAPAELTFVPAFLVDEAADFAEQERAEYVEAIANGPGAVSELIAAQLRTQSPGAAEEDLGRMAENEVRRAGDVLDRASDKYAGAFQALNEVTAGVLFAGMDAQLIEAASTLVAGGRTASTGVLPQNHDLAMRIREWALRDVDAADPEVRAHWLALTQAWPARAGYEKALAAEWVVKNPGVALPASISEALTR